MKIKGIKGVKKPEPSRLEDSLYGLGWQGGPYLKLSDRVAVDKDGQLYLLGDVRGEYIWHAIRANTLRGLAREMDNVLGIQE